MSIQESCCRCKCKRQKLHVQIYVFVELRLLKWTENSKYSDIKLAIYLLITMSILPICRKVIKDDKNSTLELISTHCERQEAALARKNVFIPRCEWHNTGTLPQCGQTFYEFTKKFSIFVPLQFHNLIQISCYWNGWNVRRDWRAFGPHTS